MLGCIAEDNGEETDWNKLAGKAIGKVISSTANKTLGGDYIGDIDMKVMLFENNTTGDKDSSYFKVPVSLDRWVKNLSLIFGYTQDQSSENRTYDQALYAPCIPRQGILAQEPSFSITRTERHADLETIPDQHGYRKWRNVAY